MVNDKSLQNLKPIQKGESRVAVYRLGRKKELKTLFKEAVTKQDWLDILNMAIQKAKEGDSKAREFLFDRYFGKVDSNVDDSSAPKFVQNNYQIDVAGKSPQELMEILQEAQEISEDSETSAEEAD